AAAALGPLLEVLEAAEGVADPVLPAVADHQDALDAERVAALGAAPEGVVGIAVGDDVAAVPRRALDDPRDDVLQTAEDGLAPLLGLGDAEAVVGSDRG